MTEPETIAAQRLAKLREAVNKYRYRGVYGRGPITNAYHWPMYWTELEVISLAALDYILSLDQPAPKANMDKVVCPQCGTMDVSPLSRGGFMCNNTYCAMSDFAPAAPESKAKCAECERLFRAAEHVLKAREGMVDDSDESAATFSLALENLGVTLVQHEATQHGKLRT